MNFEFDYHGDNPEMAQAEAQQQMAFQLKRIADAIEERDGS